MHATIPVLEDMNGYFDISVYESTSDGYFRRTAKHPFKVLSGLIAGVSAPVGTIELRPHVRSAIKWRSPTVISYEEHYPSSVYKYFRNRLKQRKYYIATVPDNTSHANKMYVHELHFKPGVPPSMKKLFSEKFIDAMHLWGISKNAYRR